MSKASFRTPASRVLPRAALVVVATIALSSCTGMLLGGSSAGTGRPLGSDSRSSSRVAADNAISAEIRERLASDNTLSRFPIRVQAMSGRVTLYGTVDSYDARDQAVRIAKSVDGVSLVDNRIRVDTRPGSR